MFMPVNRVLQAYQEGRPSVGIYVSTASSQMIEYLAGAGFDFVRIDMDGSPMNLETVADMVRTAHAAGITPFVRVPEGSLWHIGAVLGMGALGVVVPRPLSRDNVAECVRAAKAPPLGDRHASPATALGGFGRAALQEFQQWANAHQMISVQIETRAAVEEVEAIARIPGLDIIQSGRGDLSYEYGVPGNQSHPLVVAAQARTIEAGLKAGKIVSVQYYAMRSQDQIDLAREWLRKGVHSIALGGDKDIVYAYRRLIGDVLKP